MTVESKPRPNFRIVENYEPQVDYEEFKKDFLNPLMLKSDLRKKHDISDNQYNRYRERVLKETGLSRKPSTCHHTDMGKVMTCNHPNAEFIVKVGDCYVITKTIKGKVHYFGRYKDYATAKMVRDKLYKANWDKSLGEELKQIYGMVRKKSALDKAKKVYNEFEDRYFNDLDTTVSNILDDLGASGSAYRYLLMFLRENHGSNAHRGMYR